MKITIELLPTTTLTELEQAKELINTIMKSRVVPAEKQSSSSSFSNNDMVTVYFAPRRGEALRIEFAKILRNMFNLSLKEAVNIELIGFVGMIGGYVDEFIYRCGEAGYTAQTRPLPTSDDDLIRFRMDNCSQHVVDHMIRVGPPIETYPGPGEAGVYYVARRHMERLQQVAKGLLVEIVRPVRSV